MSDILTLLANDHRLIIINKKKRFRLTDYSPPIFPRSPTTSHLIQIFIFQEDSNKIFPRPQTDPFYIRDWVMQAQSSTSKYLMCGPVAGVQFKISPSSSKDLKSLGNYVNSVTVSRGRGGFQMDYFVILFLIATSFHT